MPINTPITRSSCINDYAEYYDEPDDYNVLYEDDEHPGEKEEEDEDTEEYLFTPTVYDRLYFAELKRKNREYIQEISSLEFENYQSKRMQCESSQEISNLRENIRKLNAEIIHLKATGVFPKSADQMLRNNSPLNRFSTVDLE